MSDDAGGGREERYRAFITNSSEGQKVAEEARATATTAAPAVKSSPMVGAVRVLVVEDQRDTLEFLTWVLKKRGATVVGVGTARDALAIVRDSRPDLLISDIGLPDVDGYELIRQVRRLAATGHDIPAIALSAYARPEARTRALRAGFQAYLVKPVEPAEHIAMVTRFVELPGAPRRSS